MAARLALTDFDPQHHLKVIFNSSYHFYLNCDCLSHCYLVNTSTWFALLNALWVSLDATVGSRRYQFSDGDFLLLYSLEKSQHRQCRPGVHFATPSQSLYSGWFRLSLSSYQHACWIFYFGSSLWFVHDTMSLDANSTSDPDANSQCFSSSCQHQNSNFHLMIHPVS